jgi:class 3 adenylate cyclase
LNADHITAVFTDSKGNCWTGTTRGINRLDASHVARALEHTNAGKIPFEHYGVSAGLVDPEVTYHHVLESADGNIWFTTNSALVRYNAESHFRDTQAPSVSLTSMRLFFDEIDWKQDERMHAQASLLASYFSDYMYTASMVPFVSLPLDPVFSYNLNHLTFEFASRDWCFNQSVSLYIRLEGADENWNAIPSGTITYSSLAPGRYVLHYKAVNSAGLESEEETFVFTIMPPLWKTKGFLIAMGVLLAALLFGLYKWRVRMLERDKKMLEVKVAERTEELRIEKDKSDNLLLNILPMQTAAELKEKGEAATRTYEHVSVLFTDFEGFTSLSGTMDSDELVRVLDRYFKAFDRISSQYRIEKIKTIGDAYMCASGLFHHNKSHAAEMVAYGLELLNAVEEINRDRAGQGETPWRIRIGIHSGPVIAGVVGKKKFAYDIWGDTVNTASRMESSGEPGKLNISGATADACGPYFEFSPRGQVPIKGKGLMEMYFVRGLRPGYCRPDNELVPSDLFRSEVITFK